MAEVNDISNPKTKKRKATLTESVNSDVTMDVTNISPTSEERLTAPSGPLGFSKDHASDSENVIDDPGTKRKSSCCNDYKTKLQNSHRTNNRLKKKVKELKQTVKELQRVSIISI